jgi:adenine-specific DNA methylase
MFGALKHDARTQLTTPAGHPRYFDHAGRTLVATSVAGDWHDRRVIIGAYHPQDSESLRKARGAFFTPPAIASFIANWAVRGPGDRVLEPSAGDAEFLVHAVERLSALGSDQPVVDGVELHAWSAEAGASRVLRAGGVANITVGDFFDFAAEGRYDAVIGNPPYIRFQQFAGESRAKARLAALRGGVSLSGLASSWAAFTVHGALNLAPGGRLGFVLPAELLHSNYAAPIRQFLFERFSRVTLVLFDERVFDEAEVEAVLLLAEGFGGSTDHASIRQVSNIDALDESLPPESTWAPRDPAAKWSGSTVSPEAASIYSKLILDGTFAALKSWGDTSLGIVTGNNKYFTMAPEVAAGLGLGEGDVLKLSPPGSRHLRELSLSNEAYEKLSRLGKSTLLFRPTGNPSAAARAYIDAGEKDGVQNAYKCRARKEWWRVPLARKADAFLTYMNADSPRLATNQAGALHLNSVHGVYFHADTRKLGKSLLPLAALNSVTMLGAEFTGRAFGGGMLKMEPGEAALWGVPSFSAVNSASEQLEAIRTTIVDLLQKGETFSAVSIVDQVLLKEALGMTNEDIAYVREARDSLANRRKSRGRRGTN